MLVSRVVRRTVASCFIFGLAFGPGGAPVLGAEGAAIVRGILYREDETTRLPGAVVTAINVKTGRRYASQHTGDNGAYEIAGLPAGTYDLAIDVTEQIYVTETLIDLAEAQRLYLSFAIQQGGAKKKEESAPGGEAKMTFTDPSALPPPVAAPASAPKKKGFWNSAGGKTVISILVVGAVGAGVAAQHD
jgi:carboxypeptidase family protein